MRVEIKLPDEKKFLQRLAALAKKASRSRKNFLETIIVNYVNSQK